MDDRKDALRAELKQLWLTDDDLDFVFELDSHHLQQVRDQVAAHAERTHESQRRLYETLAMATRFVPNFVVSRVASSLSPLVLAKIGECMAPNVAAEVSKGFGTAILCEIVLHMRAESAAEVAKHLRFSLLVKITERLAKRGFTRRMGELSDALEVQTLSALAARLNNADTLASVASSMTSLDKVSELAHQLESELLREIRAVLQSRDDRRTLQALALEPIG